jgi:hypothetical protein
VSDHKKVVQFQVTGQAESAPASFSNFMAVSQVGTEVQFEFVFLDLNVLATRIEQSKEEATSTTLTVDGRTVAKVVMPAAVFAQMKEQLDKIFNALGREGIFPAVENRNERCSTGRVG